MIIKNESEKEIKEKTKKASEFLKKLTEVNKTSDAKVLYVRKLFYNSGNKLILTEDYSQADDNIRMSIYNRGISGIIKDEFKDNFCFDGCCNFLEKTSEDNEKTYSIFGIGEKIRKDFQILCKSIALQLQYFVKYKDEAVYETVKEIYKDLIINDDNKDTLEVRKQYFNKLKSYDKNNIKKYLNKIKCFENVTIFFDKSNARKFYDVFVCNNIIVKTEENNNFTIDNISIPKLLTIPNNHLFLEAEGGIGKTMMMKHFLLSAIYNFDEHFLLPLFINLRDYQNEESFEKFILKQINSLLETPISTDALTSLLDNGQCIILLDGLDEINTEFLYEFDKQITVFGTRFNKNYIIISSRPYQNNDYLNTFTKLTLNPFTKNQSISLINKLNYKPEYTEIAEDFIDLLEEKLYDDNKEFCENPLLLTIMLMTYDKSGIPENRYEFYEKAYWALTDKYNPYRGKKHGNLYTKITPNRFLEVLCRFCFETYHDYKFSFTKAEIESYTSKIKNIVRFKGETFSYKEFLNDLTDHLCLLHKNGNEYSFVHRSFQEFFCARYFSTQSAVKYESIGKFIDQRDRLLVTKGYKKNKKTLVFEEYVYDMFYAMNPDFFEELILLPILGNYIKEKNNIREEFLFFIDKAYSKIYYELCNKSTYIVLPISKSNIINKLLTGENIKSNIEQPNITIIYPEFYITSYKQTDDKVSREFIKQPMSIEQVEEEINNNEYSLFGFKPIDIIKNTVKYEQLILELEKSILHDYFIYLKNFYTKLKNNYTVTKELSLKDTLD